MRVYYISGYGNDVYYVRAENEEAAVEHLRKRIGKYLFKKNLADESEPVTSDALGKNIIVEFSINQRTKDMDTMNVTDMTASAYVFSQNGMDLWKDWDITTADIIGDKNVAESLEETIFGSDQPDV